MKQAREDATKQYDHAWQLLIGAAGAALLISIVSGVLLSLSINRGLSRAVSLADAVARGDLNQNVTTTSNDEIKDLIDPQPHDRKLARHRRDGRRHRPWRSLRRTEAPVG